MLNKKLDGLMDAIKEKRLVLFIGAGVSVNSGYVDWKTLVKEMADEMHITKPQLVPNYYQMIPEYLFLRDEEKYIEILRKNFADKENMDNDILDELLKWNPAHIITTNYDCLIEHAITKAKEQGFCRDYDLVACDKHLIVSKKEYFFIKMHGDIENKDALVLKESDYLSYSQNHVLIEMFIKSLLVNHVFLFVGYSMQDSTLKMIMTWVDELVSSYKMETFEPIYHYFFSVDPLDDYSRIYFQKRNIRIITREEIELPEKLQKNTLTKQKGKELYRLVLGCKNYQKESEFQITSEELESYLSYFDKLNYVSFRDVRKILEPMLELSVNSIERTLYLDWFGKQLHPICRYLVINDSLGRLFQRIMEKSGYGRIACSSRKQEKHIELIEMPEDIIYKDILSFNFCGLYDRAVYENGKMKAGIDAVYCAYVLNIKRKKRRKRLKKLIECAEKEKNYISKLIYEFNLFKDGLQKNDYMDKRRLDLMPESYAAPLKTFEDYYKGMRENIFEMQQALLQKLRKATIHSKIVTNYFSDRNLELLNFQKSVEQIYHYLICNRIYVIHFSGIQYEVKGFQEYINTYIEYLLVSQSDLIRDHERYGYGGGNRTTKEELRILDMHLLLYYVSVEDLDTMLKRYHIQKLCYDSSVPMYLVQCVKNILDILETEYLTFDFLLRDTGDFLPNLCRCFWLIQNTEDQKHNIIEDLWKCIWIFFQRMTEFHFKTCRKIYGNMWICLRGLLESESGLYSIAENMLYKVVSDVHMFENESFWYFMQEQEILYHLAYYVKEADIDFMTEVLEKFIEFVMNNIFPESRRLPMLVQLTPLMNNKIKEQMREYYLSRGKKRSPYECYSMIMAELEKWDKEAENIMHLGCEKFVNQYCKRRNHGQEDAYQLEAGDGNNWLYMETIDTNPFQMLYELRMNNYVKNLVDYQSYARSDKLWEWFTDPENFNYDEFDAAWCSIMDKLGVMEVLSEKQKITLKKRLEPLIDAQEFTEIYTFYYKYLSKGEDINNF